MLADIGIINILIIIGAIVSVITSSRKKMERKRVISTIEEPKEREHRPQFHFETFDDNEYEEYEEGGSSTVQKVSPISPINGDEMVGTESPKTPIEIDPTKLVIYSEIMKPKWDEF